MSGTVFLWTTTAVGVVGLCVVYLACAKAGNDEDQGTFLKLPLTGDLRQSPISKPLLDWDIWARGNGAVNRTRLMGIVPIVDRLNNPYGHHTQKARFGHISFRAYDSASVGYVTALLSMRVRGNTLIVTPLRAAQSLESWWGSDFALRMTRPNPRLLQDAIGRKMNLQETS